MPDEWRFPADRGRPWTGGCTDTIPRMPLEPRRRRACRRRLVIGFESLPQRLRVLHLVQDQRGEQPVVVLRGRLNQHSADDVALKQGVDLRFLARRLRVLSNVEHVRDERRVLEAEYQHVQALDAGSGGDVRVAVARVERGLERLGIRFMLSRISTLSPLQYLPMKSL